ncbi:uncharacterized protein LOC131681007 [Topomyia yanbarensis]|uniref:uncharacterized protein LOC131681007 n=1 Tax=Topomyia yanbarensis TaxID=2498891 RepID=UPI00273B0D0A|nr:uncharacterized protein LOC131681007 [Topomyia yanbarensis]
MKSELNLDLPIASRVEYLAVQANINELNIGIVVFYNPSCSNQQFSQSYEKLLIDLLDFGFDRMFLVGDFNINITALQPSVNLAALIQLNRTFNLTVLPTDATRITDNSSTTIDLLITDSPQNVVKSKTASANISDHEIIYLLTNVRIQKPPPQSIRVRNFRNVNQLQLQADFQTTDFQPIYNTEDPHTKADLLATELKNLLQRHAPERTITVRDKRTPWITNEIKQAAALRDLAFVLYSRNPNRARGDNQWDDYVRKRDRARSLIFSAKKRYAELHFDHNLPAKKLWSNLRREGIHNNVKKNTPVDHVDVDELDQFFSEGHLQLQTTSPEPAVSEPHHRSVVDRGAPEFRFRLTNIDEICRKIHEIQTNAVGSDGIPISFIKLLCPFVLPLLCHLFNTIITTNTFPSTWKKAIITPIPKTSNPIQPKDFRPISVLPAISKILEKILLSQITEHLESTNPPLLANHQSGYRKGYSTTTALTKVTHDIFCSFDRNHGTVMVLVDFSLAFNCVNHRILKAKLRDEFHFSQAARSLVSSFLEQRSQSVRIGNDSSPSRTVPDGTPQGSCLSALLFSLYINSLPAALKSNYQHYADDLQIYISGPVAEIDRLIANINEDLAMIVRWAKTNRLSPNPKKTQAIIFNRTGTITPPNAIKFSGETISLSSKVINLGLQMDSNLSWSNQVNDVVQKGTFELSEDLLQFSRCQQDLSWYDL